MDLTQIIEMLQEKLQANEVHRRHLAADLDLANYNLRNATDKNAVFVQTTDALARERDEWKLKCAELKTELNGFSLDLSRLKRLRKRRRSR